MQHRKVFTSPSLQARLESQKQLLMDIRDLIDLRRQVCPILIHDDVTVLSMVRGSTTLFDA